MLAVSFFWAMAKYFRREKECLALDILWKVLNDICEEQINEILEREREEQEEEKRRERDTEYC